VIFKRHGVTALVRPAKGGHQDFLSGGRENPSTNAYNEARTISPQTDIRVRIAPHWTLRTRQNNDDTATTAKIETQTASKGLAPTRRI
jgi:hypothetical protein